MDLPERELSPEEIAAYDEHGVVLARGLFPRAWIERMAAAVDRIVARPTLMGEAVSMKQAGFTGDLFLWKTDDDFRDWVYESPAAHIAQQVLRSPRVHHFYDQIFVKPPGCAVPTPWHHDVTFWPVDMECRRLCSIWIAFDPVSPESSGLEFVRGSQRWPQRFKAVTPDHDPYMMDSELADAPDIEAHRADYDLFRPELEAGDCLIFDAHVLHGSSANRSSSARRRAFSSRWAGEGVRYAPRHATMPLLWEHGLRAGEELAGPLFPQVLPEAGSPEEPRRRGGPEAPSPALVKQFLAAAAEVAARTGTRTG